MSMEINGISSATPIYSNQENTDISVKKPEEQAVEKGFKLATKAWGRELPKISQDTLDAANKLFEDYYKSKEQDKTAAEI